MTSRDTGFIKTFLQGFVECVLYFPVLFIPAFYLLPESHRWVWPALVLGGYLLGYTGARWFKLDRQFKATLWACLVSITAAIAFVGVDITLAYFIPLIFISSYRGSRMEQASWNLMFPGTYFLIGLILFGVSSFILSFMDSFQGGISSLTWMGAAALGLTLLLVNRQLVLDETLPGNDQPVLERRVLRYNRWFILVLLLLVAVVAFLPQLQQWVSDMARGIAAWISGWFSPGAEQTPEPPLSSEPPPEMSFFDEETKPPSPWMKVLEQVLIYGVFTVIGIGMIYVLFRFSKVLPKLYRRFSAWMNRRMNRQNVQPSLGYEDEVENIEHDPASKRLKRMLSGIRIGGKFRAGEGSEHLNEKIRRMYRMILSRSIREGYNWKASLTPRETESDLKEWNGRKDRIPQSLIELYEEARYGNRTITEEEVERVQLDRKHT
ncbi:DUF4129 domain-containing protein [Paenibacillus sp. p3-SID867]|uniref:DUF4129 domain-containing protein n=1 Tax=Paenibacillus sp. p3-SID867 TaxID=2916363 RepID=UPI0021A3FC40|nr:DUF4129 domain-containing protein [Paenibacillus sp. p3-SID867]MCT1398802.1 DUF4129 domain-containing protein [Paenibacillus sp. p3-SID867]